MTAKELAKKCNIGTWKVYYIRKKLGIDCLPNEKQIEKYIKETKMGRPRKYF